VTTAPPTLRFAHALTGASDVVRAAEEAADQALEGLAGATADLALVFLSPHYIEHAAMLARTLRERLRVETLLGISTSTPIAGASEAEHGPALSLLCASLPGVAIHAFTHDDLEPPEREEDAGKSWVGPIGITPDHRATMLFVDPTSVPIMKLLPAFNAAVRLGAGAVDGGGGGNPLTASHSLFGGIASAGSKPGSNVLLLNDRVLRHGLAGLSLSGNLHVDCVVSQGCRPVGPTFLVTRSRNNIIFELGGKPALEAIQAVVGELPDSDREQVREGLMLGVVIDEYKPRFGRGDYLIRNIVGVDTTHKCIAVADFPRVGQTVRLHLRDARTAHEDLALLMDAQRLYDPPLGALLITCNSRGERLFKSRSHDAGIVQRAFLPGEPGEQAAKAGESLDPSRPPPVPLAGFHAAGEIGPIGGTTFLHGQTACVAVFRGR
jgi:small ligand-binding sensory domain FIST